jgi:uncharacterized protein
MTTHLDSQTVFARLKASPEDIKAFCLRWHVTELALFGSILRDDFDEQFSDVDALATFASLSQNDLDQWLQMEDELAALCARKVDLVDKDAVLHSRNPYRKQSILDSAQVIYER